MPDETPMVACRIVYTRQAQKDAKKISSVGLRRKIQALLAILAEIPLKLATL
jgi:hypothetical protein